MALSLIFPLILATIALIVSRITTEEIQTLVAHLIAIVCLVFSVYFTPISVKIFLLILLIGYQKIEQRGSGISS